MLINANVNVYRVLITSLINRHLPVVEPIAGWQASVAGIVVSCQSVDFVCSCQGIEVQRQILLEIHQERVRGVDKLRDLN